VLGKTQFSRGAEAQGVFVILTLPRDQPAQRDEHTSIWDFQLKSPEGVTYKMSSEGSTHILFDTKTDKPKALTLSERSSRD